MGTGGNYVNNGERAFMKMAIEQARKSIPEDDRAHPRVGVIVVKDGKVLAAAHRGEYPGNHAEFVALEKKLGDETIVGSTLYTTLEPCTTRNHPKIPCAERIRERKVARVVVGMLDPNPEIRGLGWNSLRDGGIAVETFPTDLMSEIEELNRDFTRQFKRQAKPVPHSDERFIAINRSRTLDEWYRTINVIYWNRNFLRDSMNLFAHLVEVIGGLSLLASQKKKHGVTPEAFVPKAIAWWLALCGKVGVKSVDDMVWAKFPYACASVTNVLMIQTNVPRGSRLAQGPTGCVLRRWVMNDNRNVPRV
jgi:pyrimidine deaminase RibD-like protein